MPLQDTLDAMRSSFESKLPPGIVNTMHRATEELLQSGWTLPLPGRFIMDGHGMISHVDVHPDYTIRPEPADIVKLLGSIG